MAGFAFLDDACLLRGPPAALDALGSGPVTMAARVWTVSTISEIVTRPGTDFVTSLRRHAVNQIAASIAHKPASRPPSHAARTYAPVGSPKDSARFQLTVRSSDAGRGSSRQSA